MKNTSKKTLFTLLLTIGLVAIVSIALSFAMLNQQPISIYALEEQSYNFAISFDEIVKMYQDGQINNQEAQQLYEKYTRRHVRFENSYQQIVPSSFNIGLPQTILHGVIRWQDYEPVNHFYDNGVPRHFPLINNRVELWYRNSNIAFPAVSFCLLFNI